MSSQSGDSFDFSSPFEPRTVEAQAQTVNNSFADRFEAAASGQKIKQRIEDSIDEDVVKTYNKNAKQSRARARPSVGQWFTTFVLLLALCGVSTYALINYRDSTQRLADAERIRSVAGARLDAPKLVTTNLFTLSLSDGLPEGFIVQEGRTKFVTGFDRSFFATSVMTKRFVESNEIQSGIEVLMQERFQQTSQSFMDALKKSYPETAYTYPTTILEGKRNKNTLVPKISNTPTIHIVLTDQQVYIIVQYTQIAEFARTTQSMLSGLQLN